jgi:hypothetical protein
MENALDILTSEYGLAGLVIAGLVFYILMIEKRHRSERKEMRAEALVEREAASKVMQTQHHEAVSVTKDNTAAITELTTLIKAFNR